MNVFNGLALVAQRDGIIPKINKKNALQGGKEYFSTELLRFSVLK